MFMSWFNPSMVRPEHAPPLDLLEEVSPELAEAFRARFASEGGSDGLNERLETAFVALQPAAIDDAVAAAADELEMAMVALTAARETYLKLHGLRSWRNSGQYFGPYRKAPLGILDHPLPVKARLTINDFGKRGPAVPDYQTVEPGFEGHDPRIVEAH